MASIYPDASLHINDVPSQSKTVVDLTKNSPETLRGRKSKKAGNSKLISLNIKTYINIQKPQFMNDQDAGLEDCEPKGRVEV